MKEFHSYESLNYDDFPFNLFAAQLYMLYCLHFTTAIIDKAIFDLFMNKLCIDIPQTE